MNATRVLERIVEALNRAVAGKTVGTLLLNTPHLTHVLYPLLGSPRPPSEKNQGLHLHQISTELGVPGGILKIPMVIII
jgi:hypothetical protein